MNCLRASLKRTDVGGDAVREVPQIGLAGKIEVHGVFQGRRAKPENSCMELPPRVRNRHLKKTAATIDAKSDVPFEQPFVERSRLRFVLIPAQAAFGGEVRRDNCESICGSCASNWNVEIGQGREPTRQGHAEPMLGMQAQKENTGRSVHSRVGAKIQFRKSQYQAKSASLEIESDCGDPGAVIVSVKLQGSRDKWPNCSDRHSPM